MRIQPEGASATAESSALVFLAMLGVMASALAPCAAAQDDAATATTLANAILDRWEPVAAQAGTRSSAWRDTLATQFKLMDAATLRGIDAARPSAGNAHADYAQFVQAVRSAELQLYMRAQSGKAPAKLGSTTTDQVFIPIAPCRIVDTRNVGGPIFAGTTRNFAFYASSGTVSFASQGGVPNPVGTACPGTVYPTLPGPSTAVITVTVVSPSAAGNWVIWGGANPIPTTSALNWTGPGQILANTTVVPGGGRSGSGPGGAIQDFAVTYNGPSGSAQFIADVVGYLIENQATQLDCYESAVISAGIAANSIWGVSGAACPTGWTMVGGNCDSDNYKWLHIIGKYGTPSVQQWSCRFANRDSVAHTIYASSICCRVPGL